MAINQSKGLQKVGECLYRNSHGAYFAWFSVNGKQIKKSLKTFDRELARRRLAELRQNAQRVHGQGESQRALRFEEVAEMWLESVKSEIKFSSWDRRGVCIRGLEPYFLGLPFRSITLHEVEKWKVERGAQIAPRTFNKELETLSLLFRYARDVKGIVLEDLVAKVKKRKAATPVIIIPSKAEFGRLVKEMRKEPQARAAADFVEFLAYSGMRRGEALSICWQDVDFSEKRLVVTGGETGTKNHEGRTLPLFAPLARLLEQMKTARSVVHGDELIFKFDVENGARQALESACKRAELRHFTHHSLRHFFCSNAIEAGCDFKMIAGWLGHKDGGVLVAKTYGHLRNEHSAEMAKRITFDISLDELNG